MTRRYVIISPCRNEEKFLEKTLNSVIAQSEQPSLWVIVDDGSTDSTPNLLNKYADQYDFIKIVQREDRGVRSVGPGVIEAFYEGLSTVDLDSFDYLCKLDLDLILPPNYFSILMDKMEKSPRIGSCSGKPYYTDKTTGELISEKCGDEAAIGASKFYRVSCFKDIGGFIRQVMWDGIDAHTCRMKGWIACSWDEPDLHFIHLRPMGSSHKGILTGRARHGFGQYFMGTGLTYLLASAVYRLFSRPYVLGAAAMLWGYFSSAIHRQPRLKDKKLRVFINHYQWSCLLNGKAKATQRLNKTQELIWNDRYNQNSKDSMK